MKLIVNPHKITIEKTPVNEKEINVTEIEFVFDEEITNDYVKEAYFTLNGNTYKEIIANNKCSIPYEVLTEKGQVEIGVVAFLTENEEEIKRYNPSAVYISTLSGSLKDSAENSEPITPSELEQYEQALNDGLLEAQNVNIDAEKTGNKTTVTITNRDGEEKTVEILDGKDAKINGTNTLNIVAGTNVTINQEDDTLTINSTGGGSGGTSDYSLLTNKPSINNVTLSGNKTSSDLGLQPAGSYLTSESDPVFSASASAGITSSDITSWNAKYEKPSSGIPSTDLSSAVQTSLGKADTAIQDVSDKLDTSKVKTTTSTTSGDVYDVTYINTMLGDIETLLGGI